MGAPKGTRPPSAGMGRRKGTPNKTTGLVREMVIRALDAVGGADYLQKQAEENPNAFLILVGKVLPLQVTGADGAPLIPALALTINRKAKDDATS